MRNRLMEDTLFAQYADEDSSPSKNHTGAPVDVNNYPPRDSYDLGDKALIVQSVSNQLAQDIVIFMFKRRIAVYYFKVKAESEAKDGGLFDYVKLHEIFMDDTDVVRNVALSSDVSLSISTDKRLTYAFSLHESPYLHIVSLQGDLPERISKSHWFDDVKCRYELSPRFNNESQITHIKFDLDQFVFVACLTEEPMCNIWNTLDGKKITSFPLQEQGVGLSWHKSEPYKLMVAQRNGIIVFYNIVKQHAVQSVSVGKSPLLSIDWAPNNNFLIACTSYSHAFIVDVAKPYSSHIKCFETHPAFTRTVKFSPLDCKMFATMSRSDSRVNVFQINFQSIVWSNKKADIHDVEWLRARPYVLAIAGTRVYVYHASILS